MQPSDGTRDPAALAVAKAAQSAVHHSAIILFGSRAAGTHWADSDVALMLVCSKSPIAEQSRAQRAVRAHLQGNSPPLRVDIVPMELEDFNYCRRAKNHVASQAYCKGIIMGGGRLDFSSNDEDEYPASWPDVKWRIQAAYRNLGGFRREFEHPGGKQEDYCFHAQQAVGNSLKAWVSAAELEYSGVHDLASIAQSVREHPEESQTPAAQQLRMLLDYATADGDLARATSPGDIARVTLPDRNPNAQQRETPRELKTLPDGTWHALLRYRRRRQESGNRFGFSLAGLKGPPLIRWAVTKWAT